MNNTKREDILNFLATLRFQYLKNNLYDDEDIIIHKIDCILMNQYRLSLLHKISF